MTEHKYTMLCLGDSYTIGEAVNENDRFPNQAVALLKKQGILFENPVVIAKTGWTTDELAVAIEEENLTGTYDFVTLLIGVNNQYRGRDTENYRKEFTGLLYKAIEYANGNAKHVYVLSIPDWGQTPFAKDDKRSPEQIGAEIDLYNRINRQQTLEKGCNYIDITDISREIETNPSYVAYDKLHPSARMYAQWAERLAEGLKQGTGKSH